jgi:hypothetical protein
MNVIEQAQELLRRERASRPACQDQTRRERTPKVTVVMKDNIFDATDSADLNSADTTCQPGLQTVQQRQQRDQAFMDDVRRLGQLAQVEYEQQLAARQLAARLRGGLSSVAKL